MLGLFPAQSVRGMMWFGRQSTVELHISEAGCLSAALVRGILAAAVGRQARKHSGALGRTTRSMVWTSGLGPIRCE